MKLGEEPGKIDTKMLLTHDTLYYNNWRPLRTLKPPNAEKILDQTAKETPGHYRYIYSLCVCLCVCVCVCVVVSVYSDIYIV